MTDEEALLKPWAPEGAEDEPWWQAFLADGGQVQVALPDIDVPTLFSDALVRVTAEPKDSPAIHTDFRISLVRPLNELGLSLHQPGWDEPDRWALAVEGDWPANWRLPWSGPLNAALNREWLGIAEAETLAGRLDLLPFAPGGAAAVPLADLPEPSKQAEALANRRGYLAMVNSIARSPLMITVKNQPAGEVHKAMTDVLAKRYAEAECPPDGMVDVSFPDWGRFLGFDEMGGRNYDLIRGWLDDLGTARISGQWLGHKGERAAAWLNLLQGAVVVESGGGTTRVQLANWFQAAIRTGAWTYLDPEERHRLRVASGHSDTPLLLWRMLKTQRLPFRWKCFSAPEDDPDAPSDGRSMAALLNLTGKRRRNVVLRIKKAAAIVCQTFPEYTITIETAKGKGMWNLFADRRKGIDEPVENEDRKDGPTRDVLGEKDGPTRDARTDLRVTRDSDKPLQTTTEAADPQSCSFSLTSTVIGTFSGEEDTEEPSLGCPDRACRARTRAIALAVQADKRAAKAAAVWASAACQELHGLTHRLERADPARQRALCEGVLVEKMAAIVARQPEKLAAYLHTCAKESALCGADEDGISAEVRAACDTVRQRPVAPIVADISDLMGGHAND